MTTWRCEKVEVTFIASAFPLVAKASTPVLHLPAGM